MGDGGWGFGDGGLAPTPNPQSPIPNPQSPKIYITNNTKKKYKNKKYLII